MTQTNIPQEIFDVLAASEEAYMRPHFTTAQWLDIVIRIHTANHGADLLCSKATRHGHDSVDGDSAHTAAIAEYMIEHADQYL